MCRLCVISQTLLTRTLPCGDCQGVSGLFQLKSAPPSQPWDACYRSLDDCFTLLTGSFTLLDGSYLLLDDCYHSLNGCYHSLDDCFILLTGSLLACSVLFRENDTV